MFNVYESSPNLDHAIDIAVAGQRELVTAEFDSRHQPHLDRTYTATSGNEILSRAEFLRRYTRARRAGLPIPDPGQVLREDDEVDHPGASAIGYDVIAAQAQQSAAAGAGYSEWRGEEDGLRDAQERADKIREALTNGIPYALGDPLDGTANLAGSGQPGSWCSNVLLDHGAGGVVAAIAVGDGTVFGLDHDGTIFETHCGNAAWGVPRADTMAQVHPERLRPSFHRQSLVLPLSKRTHLHGLSARVAEVVTEVTSQGPAGLYELISGTSGNPSIITGFIRGGSAAAWQPSCWAWDIQASLFLARLGMHVVLRDGTEVGFQQLVTMMRVTMVEARKMPDLVMARDLQVARQLAALIERLSRGLAS